MFFVLPSVPPRGGSTLGYDSVALAGSSFRSPLARQIPICRAGVGFSQNVADISIACKIFGTRVCILQAESRIFIDFSCAQAHIMEYEQT